MSGLPRIDFAAWSMWGLKALNYIHEYDNNIYFYYKEISVGNGMFT